MDPLTELQALMENLTRVYSSSIGVLANESSQLAIVKSVPSESGEVESPAEIKDRIHAHTQDFLNDIKNIMDKMLQIVDELEIIPEESTNDTSNVQSSDYKATFIDLIKQIDQVKSQAEESVLPEWDTHIKEWDQKLTEKIMKWKNLKIT